MAQSARAAEYINCIAADWLNSPNKCPGYDTKQADGEAQVMLKFWRIQSNPLLPLLPGHPLWPRVVAPDRVLSRVK